MILSCARFVLPGVPDPSRPVQMLRQWLSCGDDVLALTALLVYLALAEAPLHHTVATPPSIIPRPTAPRVPRRAAPDEPHAPPLLTPSLAEEITVCCARLLSRRAAPFTRSVAFTAVAAVGSTAACMPCIDTDAAGVEVNMRDALVAGLAHAGFCGTSAPSCQALLAPLTPVFYHGPLSPLLQQCCGRCRACRGCCGWTGVRICAILLCLAITCVNFCEPALPYRISSGVHARMSAGPADDSDMPRSYDPR